MSRDPKAKPTSHRTVFISDYHHHMREPQRVNQSDEGNALLHDRWRVEPTIAWLTRSQGCRRACCIGLAAAQFEQSQACAVRNLLRWLHRHARRDAA